jgi:chromate transporter
MNTEIFITPPRPTMAELSLASLKIGCLGFGGPAGQIALMHRVFVEDKRWIDEARYLHALSFCTLLPGPEAQQLATYVGWLFHGVRGGLVAGLLFVLPGAAVVSGLSWLYVVYGGEPLVAAAFDGAKAAVMALVVEALVRMGRRALKTRLDWWIAAAAFVALAVLGLPFPVVILAALAVGLLRPMEAEPPKAGASVAIPRMRTQLATVLLWTTLWLTPIALCAWFLGHGHWLTRLGGVFAALSAVSFGGAYALLAWLQQQVVEVHGWLSTAQMVDGLGLAETTPGPLVLVNGFVGFVVGWTQGERSIGWALAGASMALWQTFAPSFLYIFAGAPYAEALRHSRRARGALVTVMAAVMGVIGSLAAWFGVHVLFAEAAPLALPSGLTLALPRLASFDLFTGGLAAVAALALMRLKANVVLVVAGCATIGLIRGLLA